MFKPVYKNGGKFYVQLKPPGTCQRNYALWQPVRRFLCFWIPTRRAFLLDDYGFERVNRFTGKVINEEKTS